MKVLVVGNGGREHALAWKLLQSERVDQVICVPGNGGTASLPRCENLPWAVEDFAGIGRFALVNGVSLVVVGPELPLALGITDYLERQGIPTFGPTKAGAQIEASKSWAKTLMQRAGVPTAQAVTFTDAAAAQTYLQQQGAPIVIKADGLAAGKGVTVALTLEEAQAAIARVFQGQSDCVPQPVLLEEYLTGEEVSILALTDGLTIRPLLPAQDHKRIGEGDTGANTGGMGAYAPVPWVTPELMARIQQQILQPVLQELQAQQIDYRGVLYAGLMITPTGDPKVIEFNCRFGDPETQAILPLLETPLETLLLACVEQRLAKVPPIVWKPAVAACAVMASGGYPGHYTKGLPILGLEQAAAMGALVFHAGTRLKPELVTDGGRVLNVVACGDNFAQALEQVYNAIAVIQFENSYYRRDIGYRVCSRGLGNVGPRTR